MHKRRIITAVTTTAAALVLGITTAGSAQAASYGLTSGTSAKGGWGYGEVVTSGSSLDIWLNVCDRGPADGRRAIVELYQTSGGYDYHYRDAEHGSGTCNDDDTSTWISNHTTYTLRVCLRNGPSGGYEACRSRQLSL